VTPVPWIRLYVTFFDHPKTRKLRRELGTVEPILRLWAWAANCCQDGDLSDQSHDDVEESSGWRGERGKAYSAMVACGFLDIDGDRVEIHGWGEKTGEGVESLTRTRALTADRVNRYRNKGCNALPNQLRNDTQERQERKGEERKEEKRREEDPAIPPVGGQLELTPEPEASDSQSEAIRKVFDHYRTRHPRACPSPKSTMPEWRKIRARLSEGSTVEDLCKAIDGYHKHSWHVENGQLGLELIVRDASHVSQGLGWADGCTQTRHQATDIRIGQARAKVLGDKAPTGPQEI
jgi:hypothetical protein